MKYKIHPLCDQFPHMPEVEFRELVADIKAKGQVDPIWVYGKMLLDGKHRLRACEELGVDPVVREWRPKHGDEEPQIRAFVLSRNFYRRQLTASQRAIVVAEMVTTGGAGRPNLIVESSTINQSEAAIAAGISRSSVNQAAAVLESGSPALVEAVKAGDVSVADAAKVVDLPKSEQTAAVKAVRSKKFKTVSAAAREPGDEPTEPRHRTPKGINGKLDFDDNLVDQHFRKLIQSIDARAEALKIKNCAGHNACINRLDAFMVAFKAWKKERR